MSKDIIKPENLVYRRTPVLTKNTMHYCPGCGHGTTHRIVAEVIEEMGIQEQTIGIAPVGCAVLAYNYFEVDMQEAAHGRAPALATAVKRLKPDFLFSVIKATATSLLLELPKQFMLVIVEKILP